MPMSERHPNRHVRTCYDHLAGVVAVALTDALVEHGHIVQSDRDFELTSRGDAFLKSIGVDVNGARESKRLFARTCLDLTERRPHIAGALGAALLARAFEFGWVERTTGRSLALTDKGQREMSGRLGLTLPNTTN